MLESNSFAVEGPRRSGKSRFWQITNANTGESIGAALEQTGYLIGSLLRLLGTRWLPLIVEVREKPDDSLVFTLQKDWHLFHSSVEVRDAMESSVGHLKYRSTRGGARFEIYDKDGKDFGVLALTTDFSHWPLSFFDGSKTLAMISRSDRDGILLLQVDAELTDQPLAKMLLLAATLSLSQRILTGAKA
jgi:hypothetical protein